MLEVIKYGLTKNDKYWVIGHLIVGDLDIYDCFFTNVSDENIFSTDKTIKPKKVKISKNFKSGQHNIFLEF